MLELILGGARSGKSNYAERRAAETGLAVTYVATAEAGDAEMQARIERHREARPAAWTTIEAPIALAPVLRVQALAGRCVIVDCLTLWLSNALHAYERFETERSELLAALAHCQGTVLVVSNEVGSGVVPLGELSRAFVDEAGRLHQAIAALSDRVTLLVAGCALRVKG